MSVCMCVCDNKIWKIRYSEDVSIYMNNMLNILFFKPSSGWYWYVMKCLIWKIIFKWLFGFYGISTFVGYLMPNPFLYK